jgi:hypothetical protein
MDAIERHSKVIGQKIRRVLVIGQYSTYAARRHDYYIGPGRAQITLGLILARQIKLGALRNEHSAGFVSEATHDCRTGHAGMTGHEHTLSRQIECAGRSCISLRQ